MGMTVHAFAKLCKVSQTTIRTALEMFPAEGGVSNNLCGVYYPAKELARSTRAYCRARAKQLRDEYRQQISKLADLDRAAEEMMCDDSEG